MGARRLGMKDILRDVVSLYGTADAGVIGNETPLRWVEPGHGAGVCGGGAQAGMCGCILAGAHPTHRLPPRSVAIRRWLAQRPEAARQLFGAERLPTLLQYDPYCRMLERHPEDGECCICLPGMRMPPEMQGGMMSVSPARPSPAQPSPFSRRIGSALPPMHRCRHAGGYGDGDAQHRCAAAAVLHRRYGRLDLL